LSLVQPIIGQTIKIYASLRVLHIHMSATLALSDIDRVVCEASPMMQLYELFLG
jgi:hypothetical protein